MHIKLPPNHVRFSNESELVHCLEDVVRFANETRDDLRSWKWTVCALFSAVQAAMILVRGPDAVTEKMRKDENGRPIRTRKVDHFQDLYDELQKPSGWNRGEVSALRSSSTWDYAIYSLKDARDNFEHPKYDGIIYPCMMLRSRCLESLDYLRYLISKSPRLRLLLIEAGFAPEDPLAAAINAIENTPNI